MKYIYVILAAIVVNAIISCSPVGAKKVDESCKTVEIISVRGSGQSTERQDWGDGDKTETIYFKDKLSKMLEKSGISHHPYELGTESYGGGKYPAVAVDNAFVLLGAKLSSGKDHKYGKSVDNGVKELRAYLAERAKKCSNSRFILAGYSQGAQVVGQTVEKLNTNLTSKIDYVALFGDPKLHLPEGEGKLFARPDACKPGAKNSAWRRGTAGCKTYQGALGARKPYLPSSGLDQRAGSWCNKKDGVCGAASIFEWTGHLKYKDVSIDDAAREAFRALRIGNKKLDETKTNSARNARDILIVVDASCLYDWQDYKSFIKSEIARRGMPKAQDRIAIVVAGENESQGYRLATDFTSDKSQINKAIDTISAKRTCYYHGMLYQNDYTARVNAIGKTLKWRATSRRVTMALDYNGLGYHCVEGLVKCWIAFFDEYPVVVPEYEDAKFSLNRTTKTQTVRLAEASQQTDSIYDDYFAHQPVVISTYDDYEIAVGETAFFDVSRSYAMNDGEITTYYWDFDDDGNDDLITHTPQAEAKFDAPRKGKVRVWACLAGDENCGLGEIDIEVASARRARPTPPTSLSYEWRNSGEIELQWSGGGENADKWFLYVGDTPMGYTEISRRSIIIEDLDESISTRIRISSLSADGSLESEKAEITVLPRKTSRSGVWTFDVEKNAATTNYSAESSENFKNSGNSDDSENSNEADLAGDAKSENSSESSDAQKITSSEDLRQKSSEIFVKIIIGIVAAIAIFALATWAILRRKNIRATKI